MDDTLIPSLYLQLQFRLISQLVLWKCDYRIRYANQRRGYSESTSLLEHRFPTLGSREKRNWSRERGLGVSMRLGQRQNTILRGCGKFQRLFWGREWKRFGNHCARETSWRSKFVPQTIRLHVPRAHLDVVWIFPGLPYVLQNPVFIWGTHLVFNANMFISGKTGKFLLKTSQFLARHSHRMESLFAR